MPLQQYLYGVVPRELGPIAFPEVEAHKGAGDRSEKAQKGRAYGEILRHYYRDVELVNWY